MSTQVANTILQQLGGNKFIAMTGAKNFVGGENSLTFQLPNRKINIVTITLTPMDDYDMTFWLARGTKLSVKKEYHGVYADMLQELFTEATGLYTHL